MQTPWTLISIPMIRNEAPRPMMTMRAQNPFLNLMRSQGPIMIRSQNIIPQTMSEMSPRPMNMSPSQKSHEGPVVTKENPNGPTIIGFSLPQLLSRVNSMIPSRMEQAAVPRVMEISVRNPFRDFQRPSMSLPEMPRMFEGLFEQINNHMGRLMSAMPQQNQSLLEHKDDG